MDDFWTCSILGTHEFEFNSELSGLICICGKQRPLNDLDRARRDMVMIERRLARIEQALNIGQA